MEFDYDDVLLFESSMCLGNHREIDGYCNGQEFPRPCYGKKEEKGGKGAQTWILKLFL